MSKYYICPKCHRKVEFDSTGEMPKLCPKCSFEFEETPRIYDTNLPKPSVKEGRNNRGQFQKRSPETAQSTEKTPARSVKININTNLSSRKDSATEKPVRNNPEYEEAKPEIVNQTPPSKSESSNNDERDLLEEIERLRRENDALKMQKDNASAAKATENKNTEEDTEEAGNSFSAGAYEDSELDELNAFLDGEIAKEKEEKKSSVVKNAMSKAAKISEKVAASKENAAIKKAQDIEKALTKTAPQVEEAPKKKPVNKEPDDVDDIDDIDDIDDNDDNDDGIYYEEDDNELVYNEDSSDEIYSEQSDEDEDDDDIDETDDEQGYDPNYDKYYDDILPELLAEKDRIPKESIIRAVVMIATVIIAAFVAAYRIV